MTNVTPMYQRIDFADVMTTGEVAKLLRRSLATVRALTERPHHPLPCINTGIGKKKQRIFLRSGVLRWMEEEQKQSVAPARPARELSAKVG